MSASAATSYSTDKPATSNSTDKPATSNSTDKQQAQPSDHDDSERLYQPSSPKFWAIMIGLYLSIFLVSLDRTIIAVAIPAISNTFKSINDIAWYGSAYMLTGACSMPIFGRIYQQHSTKTVFLVSIVIFEIGSAICGAAPSSTALIIGRAIAGLGSSGIFTGGMMIIIPLVPLRKRPMYTATFGMVFGVSSVLGPVLGGAFTDHVSWRWCFYINLPIGALTILAIFFFLHIDAPKHGHLTLLEQVKRLDPIGVFFFVPAIISLILALQWGGTTYAWSAPRIIGLLVTFSVLFVMFLVVEVMMPDTAMAPLRIVLNRSIAGSMVFVFLIYGAVMSVVYFIAIWFQAVKGESATNAGIHTVPLVLGMVVFSIISAKFTERVGYYVPVMLVCAVLASTGAGLLSTMSRTSNHNYWIGYQALFGMGIGCGFQAGNLPAQTVLSRADVPMGMALVFFMQQLGGSVFLSVSQNIFSRKLIERLSGVAGLDAKLILDTGATEIRKVVPPRQLITVVNAYNDGIMRVFLMSAIICAVMILGAAVVEWRSIKGKQGPGNAVKQNIHEGEDMEGRLDEGDEIKDGKI